MNQEIITPNPGMMVRFVSDHWGGPDDIIVTNMMAIVCEDPYGICIRGSDTLLQIVDSKKKPQGYLNQLFVVLPDLPEDKEIQEASDRYKNSLEIFENKYGWTGLIQVGRKALTQNAAVKDLNRQIKNLLKMTSDPNRLSEAKGTKKCLTKPPFHPTRNSTKC